MDIFDYVNPEHIKQFLTHAWIYDRIGWPKCRVCGLNSLDIICLNKEGSWVFTTLLTCDETVVKGLIEND